MNLSSRERLLMGTTAFRMAATLLAMAGLAAGLSAARGQAPEKVKTSAATAEQAAFFKSQVRPILEAHCFSCHGGEAKVKGGLRLTSRADVLKGGKTGPVVSLDKPDASVLLDAINHRDLKMPPKGKLPRAQIDVLTRWVKMGVPWSEDAAGTTVRHGPP